MAVTVQRFMILPPASPRNDLYCFANRCAGACMTDSDDPLNAFIKAACVPLDNGHASGTLERAAAILAAHPEVANGNIHTSAILGDDEAVRRFLAFDPATATAKGG